MIDQPSCFREHVRPHRSLRLTAQCVADHARNVRRACSRKRWWHNIQERTQSVQNGIPARSVRNDNQLPCLTFRVTGLSVPHLDGAQSIALTTHLDLHRDSFVHFLDVGNHADLATLRLQAVEGVHRQLQ